MTVSTQENQTQQDKPNDKELNFRMLEAKYEKQLAMERTERERLTKELEQRQKQPVLDDDDDEPYVDKKRLEKKLAQFGQQQSQQTQTEIQKAVQMALSEERKQNWIKSNGDFYDVLKHAERFAEKEPDLAQAILEMPEGFERQKLVYKNIKALGMDRPDQKAPSIQEKIDSNRRSPYYQPSGVGSAPYASQGNYSASGQKEAYEKMQDLKNRMRLS